ncbi:MAG: helix-turn-helix transcriptional regulator [Spirochaetia bacterium]|nr:helix-turn-helix transcriptional regulator [Spirochaetia bacterium]
MMNIPVIDVAETSRRFKSLREQHNLSVAKLQKIFSMENPQSIYNWENPEKKVLPCLDNLVILAKLYQVRIDELLVIREDTSSVDSVKEQAEPFNISVETIAFIKQNSSEKVLAALEKYYGVSLA